MVTAVTLVVHLVIEDAEQVPRGLQSGRIARGPVVGNNKTA